MDSDRKTAVIVGVLFISALVSISLVNVILGPILDVPNYIITSFAHENQLIIAAIFWFIGAFSAFTITFMLFPILRKHFESLAMGYVGFRLIESVFYIISGISLLLILTVSQKYVSGAIDASYYQSLGALLTALYYWSFMVGGFIFFGFGSLALNSVLYQSKLVPRWLSLWGLVGAVLALLFGLLSLFGFGTSSPFVLLSAPIAVQEMTFAAWLIVKGFNQSAITFSPQ